MRPRARGPARAALAALVLATLVSSAGAAPDFAAVQLQPYDTPKPAPEFALPDLGGQSVHLADFRGKVLLLFFWATW